MRQRLDINLLDSRDPFELDMWGNIPHLFKRCSLDDLDDVWNSDPRFYEGDDTDPADWLMVAEVPGGDVLAVALAPPNSGDPSKAPTHRNPEGTVLLGTAVPGGEVRRHAD